ncbi:sexual differentiation process protein isp4 [Stemphylium lycopersici]|nr:sexual differentiation process protein isp4 [Stemphylium lycopersici]
MEPNTPQHQLAKQIAATGSDTSASLFSHVTDNPFFTAGFGLAALGVAARTGQKGLQHGAAFIRRRMLVDLEITRHDDAYPWVLQWMTNYHRAQQAGTRPLVHNTVLSKVLNRIDPRMHHLQVQTFTPQDGPSHAAHFSFVPGPGKHFLRYKNAFILVDRQRERNSLNVKDGVPFETISLTTLYAHRDIFEDIFAEAHQIYQQSQEGKTVIYNSMGTMWQPFGDAKRKRPLDSVVLERGVKERIVEDMEAFISSRKWYLDRGIPYRRGYLLYGPPGTGKSSFIQAVAGHLDFNIAILNVSERGLTDDRLNHLLTKVPRRTVVLLEDVDVAFMNRKTPGPDGYASASVTFSGLLNALDGVASAEERIIFLTTNHVERLDEALVRPGRVDMTVRLGEATEYQIEQLWDRFYAEFDASGEAKQRFMAKARELGLVDSVSTAALQGLFLYNKDDTEGAISMVEGLTAGHKADHHDWPGKARNIATSETSSDDDLDLSADPSENSPRFIKKAMSRVPLLVRSSPAQGTGSYGGLPILSSSPEDAAENSVINASRKKKGKSRLANSEASLLLDPSGDDPIRSDRILSGATKSRRRAADASRSSTTLGVASGGQEECRFEARFNASGLDPSTAGAPLFDNSTSSSSTLDDNEASDDDDDLHDMKGSPSDNSRHPQVSASVAATDDISLSIDTPRMWFLSIMFSIAGSSTNLFFSLRYPSVIVEQVKFYRQDLGIMYQVLLILSTQILGYSLAGITRRYLVRPSSMIWPSTLVSTAMFTALHKDENKPADGWTIAPRKFFSRIFLGSVAFYFLPGLLFPALSYFNVITWFAPKSVVVANLFGISSGLGLFPVTFDWAQIAYIGSPLITPFWAAMNILGGLVGVMWIAAPIMYYKNVLYSSYMPILSSAVWDNRGKPYDVSKILTENFLFDEDAYKNYSRVYLPITYVLSYALQFAGLTALLSHTGLWYGKDIWRQWRRSWAEIRKESATDYQPLANGIEDNGRPASPAMLRHRAKTTSDPDVEDLLSAEDVHNRLMRRYEDVPITWYLLTGVSMAAVGMFVVEYYPVHLPWYGLLLALGIGAVLFVPIGIVMAITNQQSSIYLICQLLCGVLFPGRPVANMVFTTFGYISATQGLKFASDLKLGHYMKIPPRILFKLQLTVTIISSLTQIGVLNWMLNFIPGICTPEAINGFNCPIARVHFNGSILWGVVGPGKFFGPGALYQHLIWAFPIGAIAPVILWYLARGNRKSILSKINLAVVFGSLSWIPPATGLNFSVWAIVCYVFNYEIKNRRNAWWKKYNMMLSAALDSGLAFGVVVIFFGIVYPGWMSNFKWWGTEVYKQGCDWQACPYKEVPKGETFGPGSW